MRSNNKPEPEYGLWFVFVNHVNPVYSLFQIIPPLMEMTCPEM
jgi:hypothetical protein